MVDELRASGFRGVQFALPHKDYDDKEYYLVYARAGPIGMPALFQLGLLPNSGRDHQFNVCCGRMRPIHLDTIARAFPELTIVGTRLGCPWYEEAAEVARCNHNVCLDLSGAVLKTKGPDFFRSVLWWDESQDPYNGRTDQTRPWHKILFGSDVHYKHLAAARRQYESLITALALDENARADIMGLNAIRILGLD
jgi:predicted TIM-barrel fold metal-dependent hydrolase